MNLKKKPFVLMKAGYSKIVGFIIVLYSCIMNLYSFQVGNPAPVLSLEYVWNFRDTRMVGSITIFTNFTTKINKKFFTSVLKYKRSFKKTEIS